MHSHTIQKKWGTAVLPKFCKFFPNLDLLVLYGYKFRVAIKEKQKVFTLNWSLFFRFLSPKHSDFQKKSSP